MPVRGMWSAAAAVDNDKERSSRAVSGQSPPGPPPPRAPTTTTPTTETEHRKRRRSVLLPSLQIQMPRLLQRSPSTTSANTTMTRIMTNNHPITPTPQPQQAQARPSFSPSSVSPVSPTSPTSPRSPVVRVDPTLRKPVPRLDMDVDDCAPTPLKARSRSQPAVTRPMVHTPPSPTSPIARSIAQSSSSSSRTAAPPDPITTATSPEPLPLLSSAGIEAPPSPYPNSTTVRKTIPPMWRAVEQHVKSKSMSIEGGGASPNLLLKRNNTVQGTPRNNKKRMSMIEESDAQRMRNVWRARKMAQVFGTEPPMELVQGGLLVRKSSSSSLSDDEMPPASSHSPYISSPSTSSATTPSTSLDFGRGGVIRTMHSDDSLALSTRLAQQIQLVPSSATAEDQWHENDDEDDEFERADFRVRRLRAQKLARFFGTPAPVTSPPNAPAPAKPNTILPEPIIMDRPDTPFLPRHHGFSSTESFDNEEKMVIVKGKKLVDEYNLDEMQEVMAKLRKLR